MDWFLYDNGLRHGRVKSLMRKNNFNLKFDFGLKLPNAL